MSTDAMTNKVLPINDSDEIGDVRKRNSTGTTPTLKPEEPSSSAKPRSNTEPGVINHAFIKEESIIGVHYGSINTGQSTSADRAIVKGEDHDLLPSNGDSNGNGNGHSNAKEVLAQADLEETKRPRVYFKRWFMLAIFCMYSFSSAFQWIHLSIVGNIITVYYNESLPQDTYQQFVALDMLSMVYMIMYIPFILPATWLLDKKGLRISCLVGALINAIGAWLKCASVSGDRFAVLMTAQTVSALAQNFVLGIPPRLAAVWFGPNEVSTATSIGVFGNQVGVAIGFLVPPMIIKDSGDQSQMTSELEIMFFSTAAFTTLVFLLILIFFKDKPPYPPSRAQQLVADKASEENYFKSLKNLITNKGFFILTIAYGINTGSFYAISTLLNAMVLYYFEESTEDAGRIGLTLVLMGVLGAILGGFWLDKTKTFKSTTIAIYVLSLLGMIAFTFTLDLDAIWIVYLTAGSLGFFMTGYLPVGFEFAAEITYPESEGTSSGLLNGSAQIFGIIFTLGMRAMLENISVISANITLCAFLLLGSFLTAIIKADYKRQAAGEDVMHVFVRETEVTVSSNGEINQNPRS